MLRADLLTQTSALESIEDQWWVLWRETPNVTPFQSPAWLIPWWRAFAAGELAALALYEGGGLAAFAPFYIEQGQHGCRLLPIGLGTTDYLDILISPAAGAAGRSIADVIAICNGTAGNWKSCPLGRRRAGWKCRSSARRSEASKAPARCSLSIAVRSAESRRDNNGNCA